MVQQNQIYGLFLYLNFRTAEKFVPKRYLCSANDFGILVKGRCAGRMHALHMLFKT